VVRVFEPAHRLQTRARVAGLLLLLAALNAGAWFVLLGAAHRYPLLLALGATAFVLGMRHAVDPDHIAAIDGVTRKLMHAGRRPVAVGLFFSLGHSSIVFALSLLVAIFGVMLKQRFPALESAGTLVGTSVSAFFLLIIAAANLAVLLDILRGNARGNAEMPGGGMLSRLLRPAMQTVTQSWHMYPLGMLFGLGFDTATEIALLGISAASAAGGMPIVYILLLPLLFTAAMSLVDTAEGIAVLGMYGWAYVNPARKILYNLNMTLISVLIAAGAGGAQALAAAGILLERLRR
jgi:high-affinity nickel-transport protein